MTDLNLTTGDETPAAATASGAPLTNDQRLKDLKKQVTKLGEEASLGKDSLPKLAHAVVRAAADGLIDTTTKDEKGNDHATQLYIHYANGESKKAIHEHSEGGKKANISKLRQLISMGCMKSIDPVEVMQDAFAARDGMSREDGVKIKSAYPFYVDVAREQLKSDKPLTTKQMEDIAVKDAPAPKELEAVLKSVLKTLEGLVSGERKDGLRDKDELTEAAFNCIRDRLDNIATERKRVQLRQEAAKLGLQLA